MTLRRFLQITIPLALLCLLLQIGIAARAVVPALDCVKLVNFAQAIDAQGWVAACRDEHLHPLFPTWLWVVHRAAECLLPLAGFADAQLTWAASAQIASAIPLIATVFPLFWVFHRLFGTRTAIAASIFFCVLPEIAHLGAEGLGDSTHLFLFTSACALLVEYFLRHQRDDEETEETPIGQTVRPPDVVPNSRPAVNAGSLVGAGFLWGAGFLVGMAYLTRLEAILLLPAFAVALAWHLGWRSKQARRRWLQDCSVVAVGAAIVACPYVIMTGKVTPKHPLPLLRRASTVFHTQPVRKKHKPRPAAGPAEQAAESSRQAAAVTATVTQPHQVKAGQPRRIQPLAASGSQTSHWRLPNGKRMRFPKKEKSVTSRRYGYASASAQFCSEISQASGYWCGALALLGWWRLRQSRIAGFDRLAIVYAILFCAVVLHYTASMGYVSTRHLVCLVVLGLGISGGGALALGQGIMGWLAPHSFRESRWAAWCLVLAAAAAHLPNTLQSLHAKAQGHREASAWLASTSSPKDRILDTRGWTSLYSGRQTYGYHAAPEALLDRRLRYVVLEAHETRYNSRRAKTLSHLLRTAGEPVAAFPTEPRSRAKRVLVYRWDVNLWKAMLQRPTPTRMHSSRGNRSDAPLPASGRASGSRQRGEIFSLTQTAHDNDTKD